MSDDKLRFKICLGDLAAYNNGILLYTWIDLLDTNYEEFLEIKNKLLKQGTKLVVENVYDGDDSLVYPHEEYEIQDYSNNINMSISRYRSIEKLYEFADKIKDSDVKILKYLFEYEGITIDEILDEDVNLNDYSFIEAKNERELGEIVFNNFYGDPLDAISKFKEYNKTKGFLNLLARNFDYEKYERNLVNASMYTKVKYGYLVNYS